MSDDLVSAGIFTSETQAYHAQAALKEAGINARISEPDDGAFGISMDVAEQIDLIVVASDFEAARKILDELEEAEQGELAPAWTCQCGEEVDEGFAVCWSCGSEFGAASGKTSDASGGDTAEGDRE